MAITAADIHDQSFNIERKGYDIDEVDVFLEHVADEIDDLNAHIESLERQLEEAKYESRPSRSNARSADDSERISNLEREVSDKDKRIGDLERQLEERNADNNAISQALIIAQRSADDVLAKANVQAGETIQEAREEAARILDRANSDKQDILEAIRRLEDEREDARESYQDMLKDFISDASRKLVDLGGSAATPITPSYGAPAASARYEEPVVEVQESYSAQVVNDYLTPQSSDTVVATATPVASSVEKDLSGYGDVDDSSFDEID